jgi:hypothetical protein
MRYEAAAPAPRIAENLRALAEALATLHVLSMRAHLARQRFYIAYATMALGFLTSSRRDLACHLCCDRVRLE